MTDSNDFFSWKDSSKYEDGGSFSIFIPDEDNGKNFLHEPDRFVVDVYGGRACFASQFVYLTAEQLEELYEAIPLLLEEMKCRQEKQSN